MRQRHQLLLRYRDELARDTDEVARATEEQPAYERVVARLGEIDARVLGDVIAALHRLEAGTYGTCSTCGGEIGEARLDALPTTTLCVACASPGMISRI